MKRRVGLGDVVITDQARRNVLSALDANRLSYGPWSEQFERRFAELHGRKFACFMNSGTSALQVGLRAMKEHYGWPDGAAVLVPALTFVASYNTIVQAGLTPRLVDIRLSDYGMDRELIDFGGAVAVMPVHLFGRPSDPQIRTAARLCGVKVIADSCETMFMEGCAEGEVSCFSTYACHILNTGVGGLATTNDPELAMLIRSIANHGRNGIYTNIDQTLGARETMAARFQFDRIGYSYRATELEAAIGCAELDTYAANLTARWENADFLVRNLSDLPLVLPRVAGSVHMMLPILSDRRDALCAHLEASGIETRPMLPLTNQPYLRGVVREADYPVSARVNREGLYVASHQHLSQADLEHMVDSFRSFFA